ncbi:MAG: biopolymer transporter ExbD [Deltaproteobacteria bacterium]|nr:MAG: biopolymer transporter ExbD [Deltaproteobacteria bacterium]
MAGTMGAARGRGGTISAINVTPLVDVVLVLLIILMVASTYIVAQTLKVTLPRSKSTDGTADKPQTVAILKDGSLRWNDQPVTEPQLVTDLAAAVKADPEVNVVVSADESVKHGRVVHIIDVAKQQGVTKFAINVMAGAGE